MSNAGRLFVPVILTLGSASSTPFVIEESVDAKTWLTKTACARAHRWEYMFSRLNICVYKILCSNRLMDSGERTRNYIVIYKYYT